MPTVADNVDSRFLGRLIVLLLAIAAWGTIDLVLDGPEVWESLHGPLELGYVALCLGSVVYLWS